MKYYIQLQDGRWIEVLKFIYDSWNGEKKSNKITPK